ncbi:hypothetical protein HPB47_006391 [Ixodes persulcatus]|uniref:Uncharacterized protein n=1 Tax=Ixodes persulcatus TaxID=34615 RepID=A0AC60PAF5_IXOPE|nr:hypothetical protein HPB47_006391 [Ixodes persulcatus]
MQQREAAMPAVVALLVVGLLSLSSAQYAGYTDNRIDSGPIHHQQPTHLIVASRLVRPGQTYQVVVTMLQIQEPVTVLASIQRNGVEVTQNVRECKAPVPEVILLKVPPSSIPGSYRLRVEGNINGVLGGTAFSYDTQLDFSQRSMTIFIQTDRPLYMQDQTVQFRALPITTELKPFSDAIDVYMLNPNRTIVRRWLSRRTNLGAVSLEYPLSLQPAFGKWTIQVIAQGQVEEKSFIVEEYYQTRFEVNVTLPSFFMATHEYIHGSVEANFTSGAAVTGNLTLRATVEPIKPTYKIYRGTSRYIEKVYRYFEGVLDFHFSLRELGRLVSRLDGMKVVVTAYVGERFLDLIETGFSESVVFNSSLQLRFLGSSPQVFRPGMPFKAYVSVAYSDGSPLPAEYFRNKRVEDMLRVTQSVTYVSGGAGGGQMLNPVPTPVSGSLGIWEVVLESTPSSSDSSSVNAVRAIRLEADFYDANYGQVRASLVAYSSYSPTNHHIQVMTSTKNPKVGEYIIFHVRSNYYVECFSYIFNMTLNNRKDKTGDTIEVAIYGDPGTYVALSAVDRTLYNMQAGTEISYSEVLITLASSPDYKFVSVGALGRVNSYAPETFFGEHQHLIFIKPGKSAVVYMPIVAMRIGTINVTVLSKTQIAKDMVTRSILVEVSGNCGIRLGIVCLEEGAYLIKYLDTNITETPILPFRQDRLYIFGSNKATLSIVGDVVGPAFPTMPVNATSLLSKPFYCGEQNMFSFAANLYTLLYLRLTNQRDVSIEKQAFKYLNLEYQRQLSYQNDDGSFSVFRWHSQPSVWLTSFCARVFHKATFQEWEHFLYIDPTIIQKAIGWLLDRQSPEGSFHETSFFAYDRKMSASSENPDDPVRFRNVSLTAHVLITLAEVRDIRGVSSTPIASCLSCSHSSVTLSVPGIVALQEIGSRAATARSSLPCLVFLCTMKQLMSVTGGMRYWSRSDLPAPPVLIENNRPYLYPRLPFTNDASNVETTSYGLLVHVARQAVVQKEIVEWLNTQRLSHGAWASTQDTLMAMQALTEFSVQSRSRDVTDITVTVEAPSTPGFTRQLHIGRDNLSKLQTLSIPNAWGVIIVRAQGSGLAIVQLHVEYNVDTWRHLVTQPPVPAFALNIRQNSYGRNSSHVAFRSVPKPFALSRVNAGEGARPGEEGLASSPQARFPVRHQITAQAALSGARMARRLRGRSEEKQRERRETNDNAANYNAASPNEPPKPFALLISPPHSSDAKPTSFLTPRAKRRLDSWILASLLHVCLDSMWTASSMWCRNRPSIADLSLSPKPKMAKKRQDLSLETKQSIVKDVESGMKNVSVVAKYNLADTTVSTVWKNREQVRKQLQQYSALFSRTKIRFVRDAENSEDADRRSDGIDEAIGVDDVWSDLVENHFVPANNTFQNYVDEDDDDSVIHEEATTDEAIVSAVRGSGASPPEDESYDDEGSTPSALFVVISLV